MKGGEKMRNPDIELAVRLYYESIEIGSQEIMQLYSCSPATAKKKKEQALDLMAEEKKRPCLRAHVNTRIAFRAWGIDIADFENRLKKLRSLKLKEG